MSTKKTTVVVKRTGKKKTYGKNKKFFNQMKLSIGFPEHMECRMRYSDYGTIDAENVPEKYVYSANGLYDPNITGVGHQPMFFDTYSAIYNHYTVISSKITATFWTEDAATTYGSIVGVKLDDDTLLNATTIQTCIEQPQKLFRYRHLRNQASAGDMSIVKVKQYFSAKDFFGIKDIKDNQDLLGSATNSNPSEQAYYILAYGHPDASTDVPAIKFNVVIEYVVHWRELRSQNQS